MTLREKFVKAPDTEGKGEIPETVEEIAEGFVKSPDQDPIAPTGTPLIPNAEAGSGLSPWLWGSALIIVLVVLAVLFGR
jgi:hypothetical protein